MNVQPMAYRMEFAREVAQHALDPSSLVFLVTMFLIVVIALIVVGGKTR